MTKQVAIDPGRAVRVLACLAIVAALHLASGILIPAALAVLLTFLLYPLVRRLQTWRINRAIAIGLTIALITSATALIAILVGRQMLDLSLRLPDYRDNLRQKIHSLRWSSNEKVARLSGTIRELKEELAAGSQPATAQAETAPVDEPVKVEVVDDGLNPTTLATNFLQPLFFPIAEAGITLLLLTFLLLHSDDLRGRLISLAGTRHVSLTTSAINEIGERIGRYLRMQLLVNVCYGLMVSIMLFALGVPNALLWGVFGGILRFVPYVGPWVASVLPTLLTIAVFPGWTRAVAVVGGFILIEFTTNLILEPWFYSSNTGISSLGVVIASVFWAWVWGPVGLILAVPLTVSLIVMGKYAPPLEMLNRLFGSDATVPDDERLYQYLLADNAALADELIESRLKDRSLAQLSDQTILPALCALKRDLVAGRVNGTVARRAIETLQLVLPDERTETAPAGPPVVCIAAQNEVDAAAARLLVRALRDRGVPAEPLSADTLAREAAEHVTQLAATQVMVVQLEPYSPPHSARLFRALSALAPESVQLIDVAPCGAPTSKDQSLRDREIPRVVAFERLINRAAELHQIRASDNGNAPVHP